ncbi:MAG: hypothetical protein HZA95_01030 [Candidatus Vogelbacteria bacterium]|nr:hypothetical protein [Candidatus Vogelbacteria bacterium]
MTIRVALKEGASLFIEKTRGMTIRVAVMKFIEQMGYEEIDETWTSVTLNSRSAVLSDYLRDGDSVIYERRQRKAFVGKDRRHKRIPGVITSRLQCRKQTGGKK